jgi:hypothetical protein
MFLFFHGTGKLIRSVSLVAVIEPRKMYEKYCNLQSSSVISQKPLMPDVEITPKIELA